jgi:hypothetical protein
MEKTPMTTNLLRKSLLTAAAAATLATSSIAFAGSASADPHFVRWGNHERHEHDFDRYRGDRDDRFGHFRFGCWRMTWHGPVNVCRW